MDPNVMAALQKQREDDEESMITSASRGASESRESRGTTGNNNVAGMSSGDVIQVDLTRLADVLGEKEEGGGGGGLELRWIFYTVTCCARVLSCALPWRFMRSLIYRLTK